MYKVLVGVDGSAHSERAVRHLVGLIQEGVLLGKNLEVHLVNVQAPLPLRIAQNMAKDEIELYYGQKNTEESHTALALLKQEGIGYTFHALVGNAAASIIECAKNQGCASIVLGSHGSGFLAGIFLGSVAAKVVQLSEVPVTLIK